ncbi:MAG: polysaccharide deacetylase [Geobacter sp.]|nr:MAG: polysaccharide deacetylase [Geobacter sp.]
MTDRLYPGGTQGKPEKSPKEERPVKHGLAFLSLLFAAAFLLIHAPWAAADTITGYTPIFRAGHDTSGTLQVAIRQFKQNGLPRFLIVNPATFATATVKESELDFSRQVASATLQATPYLRTLDRHTAPPYLLQNHGARHADQPVNGVFLTIDMCPSSRPFEREFFATVARLPQGERGPVPVAVAMTGRWLQQHPKELAWIKELTVTGRLAITWVNHSLTHPFDPKAPLEHNFLLKPGTDSERELLATEVLLLENDLLPGPYFRFPGLVADGRLIRRVRELGLIPIGADAWLAKGETPGKGSFILVHGNGNEPPGIKKALTLFTSGQLHLLPLDRAFTAPASP